MEFYERNTAASSKTFTHNQRIENFSVRLLSGSTFASRREHSGCHWTFILDGREDGINVMFGRDDAQLSGSSSFAKVKLSIVDCFGFSWFQAEKNVRFESSSYTRSLLFLDRDYLLKANWGLNSLRYVPDDTLTLKWEVTTYQFAVEDTDAFVMSGTRTLWKFLVARWRFFLLCFMTALLLVLVSMVVAHIIICVYSFLKIAMFWFLDIAYHVLHLILFSIFIYAVKKFHDSHNRCGRQMAQVLERQEMILPHNQGILRYERVRSMGGITSFPNRYNHNNRSRYLYN